VSDSAKKPATPPAPAAETGTTFDGLRRFTAARIGLLRSGASLATKPLLDFRLAHARARDAVHDELDVAQLHADLAPLGLPAIDVASAAASHQAYLTRPDLGRQLAADSVTTLEAASRVCDIVFVVADGLSARAVQAHAAPLLALVIPELVRGGWRLAPLVVARHGRVAIGDAVAIALQASLAVILIGERPGLSAPDSMGAYLTWEPKLETTDAERNCISNIRPDGVGYDDAAFRLLHLLHAMRMQKMSGVHLKDDSDRLLVE
jgi:ethanolamine ammonia-lyase small subunit